MAQRRGIPVRLNAVSTSLVANFAPRIAGDAIGMISRSNRRPSASWAYAGVRSATPYGKEGADVLSSPA